MFHSILKVIKTYTLAIMPTNARTVYTMLIWLTPPIAYSQESTHQSIGVKASNISQPYQLSTLKNGLQVITIHTPHMMNSKFNVYYHTGSLDEQYGETGLAHVLEHMMFKTSKHLKEDEIIEIVNKNGGQQNAMTFYNYTGYYQTWPDARGLDLSFAMESERMKNMRFSEKELEKEIKVVFEEKNMRFRNSPLPEAFQQHQTSLYKASNYKNPIIGWTHDLNTLTLDDVYSWYERWYHPNNAFIIVQSNLSHETIVNKAQQFFGKIKSNKIPVHHKGLAEDINNYRSVTVHMESDLNFIMLDYLVPTLDTGEIKEIAALQIIKTYLSSGESSRLSQYVRNKQNATSANAMYSPYLRGQQYFEIYGVSLDSNKIPQVKTDLLNIIETLKTAPIPKQELTKIKNMLKASLIFHQDDPSNLTSLIVQLHLINKTWDDWEQLINDIKNITPTYIMSIAKKYFSKKNRVDGLLTNTNK